MFPVMFFYPSFNPNIITTTSTTHLARLTERNSQTFRFTTLNKNITASHLTSNLSCPGSLFYHFFMGVVTSKLPLRCPFANLSRPSRIGTGNYDHVFVCKLRKKDLQEDCIKNKRSGSIRPSRFTDCPIINGNTK